MDAKNLIYRQEYESRETRTREDIKDIENKLDSINDKLDSLILSIAKYELWKLIGSSLISFALGGGLITLLFMLIGK